MLSELSRQLEMVKATRIEQQSTSRNTIAIENYEAILHQKGKLESDILKLKDKLNEYDSRIRQFYEVQEKMKRAELRNEQLQEEVNMLKGKLIVV